MNKRALSQIKTLLGVAIAAVGLVTVFQNCAPSKHTPDSEGLPTALTPKPHDSDPALLASAAGPWKITRYEGNFCSEKSRASGDGNTVCAQVLAVSTPADFALNIDADGNLAGSTGCHRFSGKVAAWTATTAEAPPSQRDAQHFTVSSLSSSEDGGCDQNRKSESANLILALGNARYFTVPAASGWVILTSAGGTFSLEP